MIVETTDKRLFAVTEAGDNELLARVWRGVPVRRAKIRGTYERKPNATPTFVRKADCKVVSQFKLRD